MRFLSFCLSSLCVCLCVSSPIACSDTDDPVSPPGADGGAGGEGGTPAALCDPAVAQPGDACDDASPGDLCHLGPRGSCLVLDLICRNGVWTQLGDADCEAGGQGGASSGGASQGGASQGGAAGAAGSSGAAGENG